MIARRMSGITLTILFLAASVAMGGEDTEKVFLNVVGMYCPLCPHKVKSALESVPGVKSAKVSLWRGEAIVKFENGKLTSDQLVQAVERAGYRASPVKNPELTDKVTLEIEMMDNPIAARKVQIALKEIAGVKAAEVGFEDSKAVVEYERGEVSLRQLVEAIERIGGGSYKVSVVEEDESIAGFFKRLLGDEI